MIVLVRQGGKLDARKVARDTSAAHILRMVTLDDVRNIALSLPGAEEGSDRFGFTVDVQGKPKGFAWSWLERIHPKQARIENLSVLAVRTTSVAERDLMIQSDPIVFFTEPHYNGYPAVLVRLAEVSRDTLEDILLEGWRHIAPREMRDLVL